MSISEPRGLPAVLRRQQMLSLIGERGFVTVADLSAAFGVTSVTVRADLDALDQTAVIQRVHGGAVVRGRGVVSETSFEESAEASVGDKRAIGLTAAALVRPGQSVILDVGTTTTEIARALVARTELADVTIITNGLNIALELEAATPRFTVIVTGGTLRSRQHSLVNPLAAIVLRELHADLAFIGCTGVDVARGVTNVNLPEAEVKRLMLGAAARGIVVADSTKLGQVHLGLVGSIDEFDTLITGHEPLESIVTDLEAAGLRVLRSHPSASLSTDV